MALPPFIYGTYVFPISHFRSLKLNSRFFSFHNVTDANKNSHKIASIQYVPRAIIENDPTTHGQDLLFNLGPEEMAGKMSTLSWLSRKRKYEETISSEEFHNSSLVGLRNKDLNSWKQNNVFFDKLQVSHQVIPEKSLIDEAHTSGFLNEHLKNVTLPLNSMKFNFYADSTAGQQDKNEKMSRLLTFPKHDGNSILESKDGVHKENHSNFQLPLNSSLGCSISHSIDRMLGNAS